MAAETVHGVVRSLFLVPLTGDLPARQIGVLIGSVLILGIAFLFDRSVGAEDTGTRLRIGFLWLALTLAFELSLGVLILGLSRERILSDYAIWHGGLMPVGLIVLVLSPLLAARMRRWWSGWAKGSELNVEG
ncbi:MAG: hypothetical protein ABIZ95_01210 [Pyrinomonadaceae bacterium]